MNETRFEAVLGDDGDEVAIEIDGAGASRLVGVGCPELLRALEAWRPRLLGEPAQWPLPEATSHAELLVREAILRVRGEWSPPLEGAELCHCRAVPAREVDLAIVRGARDAAAVGLATGAGMQCGTCRPDIRESLEYRLGRKA